MAQTKSICHIGEREVLPYILSWDEDGERSIKITRERGIDIETLVNCSIGSVYYELKPKEARQITEWNMVSAHISRDNGGYYTVDKTYEFIKDKAALSPSCWSFESTNVNITLQQTALINHERFKWIAKDSEEYTETVGIAYTDENGITQGTEITFGPMTLLKAVQQYVDVQYGSLNSETDTSQEKLDALKRILSKKDCSGSSESGSALQYANYILSGVDSFLLPQMTANETKTKPTMGDIPESIINAFPDAGDAGYITKNPFSASTNPFREEFNCYWSFLESGYDLSFDAKGQVAKMTRTTIGLPTALGGGWDNYLYYGD